MKWVNRHFLHYREGQMRVHLADLEGSWKRHLARLQTLFAPDCVASFAKCDVTKGIDHPTNQHVRPLLSSARLLLFAYVCHETSMACSRQGHAFYKGLAAEALQTPGTVLLFLDVMQHSARCFGELRKVLQEAMPACLLLESVPVPENAGALLNSDIMVLRVAPRPKAG
jgi:hypothetical protein